MTKYRFTRTEDGTITVRAVRVLGKQLVASVTKVIGPEEDVAAAMNQLYKEVHAAATPIPLALGMASEREVGP